MINQAEIHALRENLKAISVHDRDHILEILKKYDFVGTAVEVGTFNGTFANELLGKTNISKLICVDPYAVYAEFRDAINDMNMEEIFAQAQRFLSGYKERVSFLRKFSEPASNEFADASLDFVYVDGNHQSAYVTQDLEAWWPKVREGGFLIGDDCVDLDDSKRNADGDITLVHRLKDDGTPDLYGDYGVFHALRGFAEKHDLGYILLGSQFILPK